MINKAILVGRLGKDPEIRYLQDGTGVATFSVATDEVWKDKNGEKVQNTTWHNIVAWKKLAEICAEYLKKGSLIFIEGKIQNRKWVDKEGVTKYTSEIVAYTMKMLGSGAPVGERDTQEHVNKNTDTDVPDNIPNDDVPF